MALRPLPSAVSPFLALACLSPDTIKGRGAPPAITTLTPALLCSLPSPQPPPHRALTAAAPFPSVARPPRRRSSSGEALNGFPDPDSPSSAPSPAALSPGVAGGRAPASSRGRPWPPVHGGPGRHGPRTRGLGPQVFL
jgi:hypothetical protein